MNPNARSLASGKVSKRAAYPLALDPRIDVVVGRQEGDNETRVLVLANTGNQSDLFAKFEFAVSPVITEYPNPRGVAVWDMNADGFPDIITANAGSNPFGNDATEGFSVLLNRTE